MATPQEEAARKRAIASVSARYELISNKRLPIPESYVDPHRATLWTEYKQHEEKLIGFLKSLAGDSGIDQGRLISSLDTLTHVSAAFEQAILLPMLERRATQKIEEAKNILH